MQTSTLVLSLALLASSAAAQWTLPSNETTAGTKLDVRSRTGGPPSSATSHILDVQALGGTAAGYTANGMLGVCVDNLLGHIWVSGRRDTTNLTNPHKLFEFWWDPTGSKWNVEVYDQPAGTAGSSWGIRDLAQGGGANIKYIYGGCERTVTGDVVYAFDVTKSTTNPNRSIGWTPAADWKSTNVDSAIGTIRALAYHPITDTMYTCDFSSDISEFRKDGTQVRKWTPTPTGNATYGLAYDPLRRTLVACGQGGTTNTLINMVAYEIDPLQNTFLGGFETGSRFLSCDLTIPGTNPGGLSGGCSIHIEKRKVPTTTPSVFNTIDVPVLTWLTQATSDSVIQQIGRFQQHPYDASGSAQPANTGGDIGMNNLNPYLGNSTWEVTLTGASGTQAALGMALLGSNIPFLGGTLSVDTSFGFFFLGLAPLSSGKTKLGPLPIPNTATLEGVSVYFQWLDSNGGLSTAGGVRIQKG